MKNTERVLRLAEVEALCALSKATIYRDMNEGTFPKNFKIGKRAVGWCFKELTQWIEEKKGGGGLHS